MLVMIVSFSQHTVVWVRDHFSPDVWSYIIQPNYYLQRNISHPEFEHKTTRSYAEPNNLDPRKMCIA